MAQDSLNAPDKTPKTAIPAGEFIKSHLTRVRHSYDSSYTILESLKTLSESNWSTEKRSFAWQPMGNLALNYESSLEFARSSTLHQFSVQIAHLLASLTRLLIQVAKEDDLLPETQKTESTPSDHIWIQALEAAWDGKLPEKDCWATIAKLPQILMQNPNDHKCILLRPDFHKGKELNDLTVTTLRAELTTKSYPPHRQAMEWLQILHFTAGILMHETISRVKTLRPVEETAKANTPPSQ